MSGQMSATGSGYFGSLLNLLGHSEGHVGVTRGQVGHDSVSGSCGVVGAVMLDGGGHYFGSVGDGSFTAGSS